MQKERRESSNPCSGPPIVMVPPNQVTSVYLGVQDELCKLPGRLRACSWVFSITLLLSVSGMMCEPAPQECIMFALFP